MPYLGLVPQVMPEERRADPGPEFFAVGAAREDVVPDGASEFLLDRDSTEMSPFQG